MCLATDFEIIKEIGMAMIADSAIVIRIAARFVVESWVICEIANAAPVRDFWKRKSVTKDTDITSVFIEPSKIKNSSLFDLSLFLVAEIFGIISEPMIAAWLEPSPGKNEQIGEIKIVVRVGPIKSFLFILSFSIFCSGTIVLDFIE